MEYKRQDHEPPLATSAWGWRYHHIGIPTKVASKGETGLPKFKCHVSGFEASPFGIEWMRYEEGSPVEELTQQVPHIAFEVDNIEYELSHHGFQVLTPINSPDVGIKVAMIIHDGAPIELIEFTKE
jgi:hypothetical protein